MSFFRFFVCFDSLVFFWYFELGIWSIDFFYFYSYPESIHAMNFLLVTTLNVTVDSGFEVIVFLLFFKLCILFLYFLPFIQVLSNRNFVYFYSKADYNLKYCSILLFHFSSISLKFYISWIFFACLLFPPLSPWSIFLISLLFARLFYGFSLMPLLTFHSNRSFSWGHHNAEFISYMTLLLFSSISFIDSVSCHFISSCFLSISILYFWI